MTRMKGAPRTRAVAAVSSLLVIALAGCGGMKKVETETEGAAAAQRAALAQAQGQAAPGSPDQQGAPSSIPNLVPGEGHVSLPLAPAGTATAPPPDKFDKDNPAHLLARCKDRAAANDWFDAVGDCRRSYELDPKNIEPQEQLMRLLVTLQSYADAKDAAEKVIAAKPNDAVAYYYLAWAYRGRQEYDLAIENLKKAIALDPARVEYVQALGKTYCLDDNFGKGIETLEKALAMRPGDTGTQGALNSAKEVLADHLAPYLKLVQEKPDSYDSQAALGFMYQKYGLYQKAQASYDLALSRMPSPIPQGTNEVRKIAAQVYYNRGVVYRELGKPDLAEPSFWQAMQLDQGLAAFGWYYTGLCRYDLGKYDTSIDALKKSVDMAPDAAENRQALGDSYAKAGKADLATEQYDAAAKIRARKDAEQAAAKKKRQEEEAEAAKNSPPPAPLPPEANPGAGPAGDEPVPGEAESH